MERLTLGVEEEFLVVDAATGALVPRSDEVLPHAKEVLGDLVTSELNLCQVEVGTPVCHTLDEVRTELVRLRKELANAAAAVQCSIVAAGTHPFGLWQDQRVDASRDRYRRMEEVYQLVARQQVICGCHVHVGFSDADLAVRTMTRSRRWLPVLFAMAANSPFWQAVDSGYASYRLEVWRRWPTLGMPPQLESQDDFHQLIDELRAVEAVDDATFIYWYVRPSVRFPTLEYRANDVCASVDDTVVLTGLTRALAWIGAREEQEGRPRCPWRREVLEAAMWRAARYGLEGGLVSPGAMRPVPAKEAVEELLAHVRGGLEAHGDWDEVSAGVEELLRRGNGAMGQRAAFSRRQDPHDALRWVLAATVPD